MTRKKQFTIKSIIAAVLWAIISLTFFLVFDIFFGKGVQPISYVDMWQLKIVWGVFGLLCILAGLVVPGLFAVKTIDDFILNLGSVEIELLIAHLQAVSENRKKIIALDLEEKIQDIKHKYK